MDMAWKHLIWHQFGAAIKTLESALRACPDELWRARLYEERQIQPEFAEFWYIAYHCLFWLDFYLADSEEGFAPPAPFTLSEFDAAGLLPERAYSKEELLAYLEYGREKLRTKLSGPTDVLAPQRCRREWPEMTVAELMLYNMRHVQEHAAQLNLMLGQRTESAPGWVSSEKSPLAGG
jgi:DinB family protein